MEDQRNSEDNWLPPHHRTVSHTESELDSFAFEAAQENDEVVALADIMEEDHEFVDALMEMDVEDLRAPEVDVLLPMAAAVILQDDEVHEVMEDESQEAWAGRSVSSTSSFDNYSFPLRDGDIVCSRGIYSRATHPGNVRVRGIIARYALEWGRSPTGTPETQAPLLATIREDILVASGERPRFLFVGPTDDDVILCREATDAEINDEIKEELHLSHFTIIPTDQDFILGMGRPTFNWRGNASYRPQINERIPEYKQSGSNKAQIRQEVKAMITAKGGRFLYPFDNSDPARGCMPVGENEKDIDDKLSSILRASKGQKKTGGSKNSSPASSQAPTPSPATGPMIHHMATAVVTPILPPDSKEQGGSAQNSLIPSTIPLEISSGDDDSVPSTLDASSPAGKAGFSIRRKIIAGATILTIAILILVIVLVAGGESKNSGAASSSKDSKAVVDSSETLSNILNRGYLICGVSSQQGYGWINEQGIWEGFEVDLCRAVAAGIFGKGKFDGDREAEPVQFLNLEAGDRFPSLDNQEVDLLLAITSQTMERNVLEPKTRKGFTFSRPYLVNGLIFAGKPEFLPCTKSSNSTFDEICMDATICVLEGTTHKAVILSSLADFPGHIVAPLSLEDFYQSFKNDDCNIMAGEQFDLAQTVLEKQAYTGPYEVGSEILSKELISMVTRDGDAKFSDFVNHILQSLMTAEEMRMGVSVPLVAADLDTTTVFGDRYRTMFQDAYFVVGDYGRLYETHLESLVPRASANELNLGNTGAMFSKELGVVETDEPLSELESPAIKRIINRGRLLCGVTDNRIFSEVVDGTREGVDIDFCKAISAAIFDGKIEVQYRVLSPSTRWQSLKNGNVDVLARVTTVTMERDVMEPSTGQGFSFSSPTFHDSIRFIGEPRYVQCADNRDWSSSVCSDLQICLTEGTTQFQLISQRFPASRIFPSSTAEENVESFSKGKCNVFAAGNVEGSDSSIRKFYSGEYDVGSTKFSRESFALVTTEDDPVFSKFVDWVVNSVYYAEERGITQSTYLQMPRVDLFLPLINDSMLRNAIQAVGSYEEIWTRHVSSQGLEREGRNLLNSYPLGPMLYSDQSWDKPPPEVPTR